MRIYHGNALITALFIMTVVSIIATGLSTHLQRDITKAHAFLETNAMYDVAKIVDIWGITELSKASLDFKSIDDTGKILIFPTVFDKKNNFKIEGELIDLQSRFNLNDLTLPLYHSVFLKLLNGLEKMSDTEKRRIFLATRQWVYPFLPQNDAKTLDQYYAAQKTPYRAPGEPMLALSEFRLVSGVTATIYNKLSPNLTTLPEITPINVDTATPVVFDALFDKLSNAERAAVLSMRLEKKKIRHQKLLALLDAHQVSKQAITFESTYFLVIARIRAKNGEILVTKTRLKREKNKTNVLVTVLERQIN